MAKVFACWSIISVMLAVFLMSCSSLSTLWIRHAVRVVWSSSGRAVEQIWAGLYQMYGENDWAIYVLGSSLTIFVVFCVTNIVFGVLDLFGVPPILLRYKIQKEKNVPMELKKYLQALIVAVFNMSVVVVANTSLIWYIAKRTMTFGYELPTLGTALIHMVLCVLLLELGFYTQHRYMHTNPFLYKHIHKVHHEWNAPCSITAFYCHPVEQFFVNICSNTLPPAVVGTHLSIAWLFWALGTISTTLAHSGYHLPFLPSSQSHDFHHHRGSDNYGTFGLLDGLLGSNRHFKNSLFFKRHFILFGLTPVDEMIKSSAAK